MNIIRSVLAVLGGYTLLIVLVIMVTLVFRILLPKISEQPVPFNYALLMLTYVTVLTGIAGYITGVIAKRAEIFHSLALGILLFIFGVISIFSTPEGNRLWFSIINSLLQFFAAVAGGYFRERRKAANSINVGIA